MARLDIAFGLFTRRADELWKYQNNGKMHPL